MKFSESVMVHQPFYNGCLCLTRVTNDKQLTPSALNILLLEVEVKYCMVNQIYSKRYIAALPDIRDIALKIPVYLIKLITHRLTRLLLKQL